MEHKVKITHITKFAKPHKGGIESFIEMFNKCVYSDDTDIEVLSCSNDFKSFTDENNILYNRCRFLFEFASNTISPELIWKLSKVNTDVIIYHMPFIFAVVAHFLARPKYKKMIVCYHSDIVGYDKIMKPFWKLYNKFLNLADIIHVQSPQMMQNSMAKNFSSKCIMIPYLVDTSINYNTENVTKIKKQHQGKKIIFSLGRLVKYKGFIYGIEAMKYVDNAVYLIGGCGKLKEELQQFIDDNELNDKVILCGRISAEDLADYYQSCDIYLFPSMMQTETFGVVQLEAMKYSKPVINTNLGTGVNYVSVDGETGLTVEPENSKQLADAINTLIQNDELRLKYGQNARKRAEELFELNRNKNKYNQFFKGIL